MFSPAGSTTPKKITAESVDLIPVTPLAERPCTRTAEAGKCNNCPAAVINTNSDRPAWCSSKATAATTASPGSRLMTSQAGRPMGCVDARRFTDPFLVPSTKGDSRWRTATGDSVDSSERKAPIGAPPLSPGTPNVGGIAGISTTEIR